MDELYLTGRTYLEVKTMRKTADELGISVWTVHHRLTKQLPKRYPHLAKKVKEQIETNLQERSKRGGKATLGLIKPRKFSRHWHNLNRGRK